MEDVGFVSQSYVGFLFGLFCAYWAQETDRNPWLWFFFGWILAPIAGIALVYKNSQNPEERGG